MKYKIIKNKNKKKYKTHGDVTILVRTCVHVAGEEMEFPFLYPFIYLFILILSSYIALNNNLAK
jgi:uncharacterized protein (DUF1919 family)